jgi:hypothetical protein
LFRAVAIARRFGVADPRVLLGLRFFSHKVGGFRGAVSVGINGNDDAFWPVMVLTGLAVVAINWGVRAPTRAATA